MRGTSPGRSFYPDDADVYRDSIMDHIQTKVGKGFEIALDANPTTGYSWEVSFDEGLLQLVGQRYERTSDLIGGGGKATFVFKSLKAGKGTITMRYRRPWEPDAIEVLRYEVIIS